MESVTLDELKIFESSVKEKIFTEYSNSISQEKTTEVLKKEYVNADIFRKKKSLAKLHGEVIRSIFSDLINKNIDSNKKAGLIEYYTIAIATKYDIEINDRPDLKGMIKSILNDKAQQGYKFDDLSFSEDVLDNSKKVKPVVSLFYENGEQYIRFIDEYGKTEVIKSDNHEEISNFFKEHASNNLDSKAMYDKLMEYMNNQEEEITSEEVNILDYISDENTDNNIESISKPQVEVIEDEKIDNSDYSKEAYEKLIADNLNKEDELFKDTTKEIIVEKNKIDKGTLFFIIEIIIGIILIIAILYIKFFSK